MPTGDQGGRQAEVLNAVAAEVVAADPADASALARLGRSLDRLADSLAPGRDADDARACASAAREAAEGRREAGPVIRDANDLVLKMQEKRDSTREPMWRDAALLQEFLSGQQVALDEIEADLLALERGEEARGLSGLRRKIHTLKGEAAALDMETLSGVYHAVEDFLDSRGMTKEAATLLIAVKDWAQRVGLAYGRGEAPPGPEEILRMLQAEEVAVAEAAAPARRPVTREPDTVALLTEFLHESEDNVSAADQTLINVSTSGGGQDAVRRLFGVFHTIKGVAGFLELPEIAEVAHATESLLAKFRDNGTELSGDALNLVFDATAVVRQALGEVKTGLEMGCAFTFGPEGSALVRRLRASIEADPARPSLGASKPEAAGTGAAPSPVGAAPAGPAAPPQAPGAASRETSPKSMPAALAAAPAPAALAAASPAAARPAADGQGAAAGASALKLRETMKVDVERVDRLIEIIGELVIAEAMVTNAGEMMNGASPRLRNSVAQLRKVTRDLQDVGLRMRMVTLQGLFQKMARLVRDLGHKSGKQLRFEMAGESTEMDRSLVEQLADPLLHIIRNAVDHGIESPEGRLAASKNPAGTVRLSAYHEGGSVIIEASDDGRGLDRTSILEKGRRLGMIAPNSEPTDQEIYALIFAPGFSTAKAVTEISGRGVGMDVVKRNIEGMRGRVLIHTEKGVGTTFRLCVPLTLAIIDGMLIACGAERYVIPTLSIVESVKPTSSMLLHLQGRHEMLNLRGKILPLARLDRLFGIPEAKQDPSDQLVVVVESSTHKVGILVDDVMSQEHVVIKSLGGGPATTPFASGAAILADGRVGLILNVEELCSEASGAGAAAAS